MTKFFLRLFSSVPDGEKPPGVHGNWPMTIYPVDDGAPDPTDGRIVMANQDALDAYLNQERTAYEQSLIDNAAAISAWKDAMELPALKPMKIGAIDQRTQEVIARGFIFAGKTFSLSANAQLTLLGTFNARTALTYPVRWNTIDDTDTYELQDQTQVEAMYAAAVAAVRLALDSGTALKDQVRAASTSAALDAIVDTR
jgi:hypothetical protein